MEDYGGHLTLDDEKIENDYVIDMLWDMYMDVIGVRLINSLSVEAGSQ